MIWLVQDSDLLSILLRALTLSLEALTVGGVLFLLFAANRRPLEAAARTGVRRFTSWIVLSLALAQILAAFESAAVLVANGLALRDAATADFFLAACVIVAACAALFAVLRFGRGRRTPAIAAILAAIVLCASVALSHAASRLDHRWLLLLLTASHHLGAALWIGAMPSLLITMRRSDEPSSAPDPGAAHALARRFSGMAIVGVALLIASGIGMSYFYVASWGGLYGSSYGVLLMAKMYLLVLAVALGASNYLLVKSTDKRTRGHAQPLLARLRRFSEAEIGLGFTAILAAASLTAQSPAADLPRDQLLTGHKIVERIKWQRPSLHSPALAQLVHRVSLSAALQRADYSGGTENDAMDRAWSDYNHHWAGLIVLAAGLFALVSRIRGQTWARNWPLLFLALAVFMLLRADPEAWPLGPRPFWASFAEADVLQHRIFVLLITVFAVFEWAVETGRLHIARAAFIFPAICAVGGALLLTHNHAFGEAKDEMLAGLSHTSIAVLGVTAGWSRWLELRSGGRAESKWPGSEWGGSKWPDWLWPGWIWPLCLVLIGLLLLDYRES